MIRKAEEGETPRFGDVVSWGNGGMSLHRMVLGMTDGGTIIDFIINDSIIRIGSDMHWTTPLGHYLPGWYFYDDDD